MRTLTVISLILIFSISGCKTPENSASLHDLVTSGVKRVTLNPFPLDSLLSLSHQDLVKSFGKENVRINHDGLKDDDPSVQAVLFQGSDREVELVLSDSTVSAKVITATIRHKARWATRDGLAPGMKLRDLEKINGSAFLFYGGGWDQGGYITNWNGGKLNGKIKACRLDRNYLMPYDMSKGDYDVHEFSSSSKHAQKGNPVIEEITVGVI